MVVLDTGDPGAQVLPLPWAQTARRLMKRWGGRARRGHGGGRGAVLLRARSAPV